MQVLRIRELRLQAGLEQKELGGAVGVTQSQVSNWELGRRYPPAGKLPLIAQALGCTINDLFAAPEASG